VTQANSTPRPTLDRDALDALAWIESGMPDDKIRYGLDAPGRATRQLKEVAAPFYKRASKKNVVRR
jgi:hypothetical protein